MHYHHDSGSARQCSRFCAANQAAREYYAQHHHAQDTAPEAHCLACAEQKHDMDGKRRQQERLLSERMER